MDYTILHRQDIQEYIFENRNKDVYKLALQRCPFPDIDFKIIIDQIKGLQTASKKIPSWYNLKRLWFPPSLSMEQCSSEYTARYKQQLLYGKSFLDLTGGLGVDTYFIAKNFDHADYLEQNADLTDIARHNFLALGAKNINCHHTNALDFLKNTSQKWDLIYVDPARRDLHNRKMVSLTDCTPDVVNNLDLLLKSTKRVFIKASPMLDIKKSLGELKYVERVIVVSFKNETKELLFKINSEFNNIPTIEAIDLNESGAQSTFKFNYPEESECTIQIKSSIGNYLYEPNSSLMKAGAYKTLAKRFKLNKLDHNTHLYTSNDLVESFPGRAFEVKQELAPNKKKIKTAFDGHKANVISRNHPLSPEQLKKKYQLKDGGVFYLIACQVNGKPSLLKALRIE